MAAKSQLVINEDERRFPVRICLAVPPGGFGAQLDPSLIAPIAA